MAWTPQVKPVSDLDRLDLARLVSDLDRFGLIAISSDLWSPLSLHPYLPRTPASKNPKGDRNNRKWQYVNGKFAAVPLSCTVLE